MQLKQLLTDDDAVSPVIGVILMVAITVILAAVIGAFVLGIGGDQDSAPQVTWDVSESTNNAGDVTSVTFTHNGGDAIADGDTTLSIGGSAADSPSISPGRMTAGSSITVSSLTGSAGDTVLVIWSPDGSDDTNVIGEHSLTAAAA